MTKKKTPPTPPANESEPEIESEPQDDPPAEVPSAVELQQLREGIALVTTLRRDNAKLQANAFLDGLASRCTPAMRRIAEPLLTELLSAPQPATVKLTAKDGKLIDTTVAVALQDLLKAAPEFKALGMAPIAEEDPPELTDPTGRLSSERLQQLQAKYKFNESQGFRNN